jgi:hypothetical protein
MNRLQELAGIINESQLNEAEDLQQFATKLATQHNLILMPQPLGKAQLFSMYQKEKGSFGNKNGVMTYEPSSKVVNVLSNDEKIPAAVYAQFKADKGGNDAGFETKTFAEKDAQIAYFKNFQIAESQLDELAPTAPASATPKQTADVASLTKMLQSNTSLMNKLKTVNSGQEVTETIAFILNNINPKASGVNKSKLKSIIDQRFK